MAIFYAIRTKPRMLRKGFLFCPSCYRRTQGEMFCNESRLCLFGLLPLVTVAASPNYLACHSCGGRFEESGDFAYDFGDHAEPRIWDCRRCGE